MTKLKERQSDAREVEHKVYQNKSRSTQGLNSPVYWMIVGAAIAIVSILASFLVPDYRQRDAVPVAPASPSQNSSRALK